MAVYSDQTLIHRCLSLTIFWQYMTADVDSTVREYTSFPNNLARLITKAFRMQIVTATEPLESVSVHIVGPLRKGKPGYFFILVNSDCFSKLTRVGPRQYITAYDVAVAFTEN